MNGGERNSCNLEKKLSIIFFCFFFFFAFPTSKKDKEFFFLIFSQGEVHFKKKLSLSLSGRETTQKKEKQQAAVFFWGFGWVGVFSFFCFLSLFLLSFLKKKVVCVAKVFFGFFVSFFVSL